MQQVGHGDPKVTLSIYARVMYGGEGKRDRLDALTAETAAAQEASPEDRKPEQADCQLSFDLA